MCYGTMIEWHNSHSQCKVSGPFHAPGQIYRVTGQIQYCPDIMTGHIVKVSESTAIAISHQEQAGPVCMEHSLL